MTVAPLTTPAHPPAVEGFFAALHDAIPTMSDDELIATHAQAEQMGRLSWEVQCHCLWEAKKRKEYQKDGAIMAVANGFQISAPRASARIKIWAVFGSDFRCRKSLDRILTEVSWYEKASETTDPHRWLAHAEDAKAANPFYTIREFCDAIAAGQQEAAAREQRAAASAARHRWLAHAERRTSPAAE